MLHSRRRSFHLGGVDGPRISVSGPCDSDPMDLPIPGDALAFFDENFVYQATARVTASRTSVCGTSILTLDRTIRGLSTSSSLIDLTQQATARYIVRNNLARECRCHGIITDSPYGWIDHNIYFDNSQGGIGLVGGSGFGPGATNLLVTNNFVSYSGQSTQYSGAVYMFAPTASGQIPAAAVFEKLGFRNNVFDRLLGPAIIATSVRFLAIENNAIINSNRDRSNPIDYGEIPTLDSITVYQASDGTVCDTQKFGDTTGPIGVDPTVKAVSAKATCPCRTD